MRERQFYALLWVFIHSSFCQLIFLSCHLSSFSNIYFPLFFLFCGPQLKKNNIHLSIIMSSFSWPLSPLDLCHLPQAFWHLFSSDGMSFFSKFHPILSIICLFSNVSYSFLYISSFLQFHSHPFTYRPLHLLSLPDLLYYCYSFTLTRPSLSLFILNYSYLQHFFNPLLFLLWQWWIHLFTFQD